MIICKRPDPPDDHLQQRQRQQQGQRQRQQRQQQQAGAELIPT